MRKRLQGVGSTGLCCSSEVSGEEIPGLLQSSLGVGSTGLCCPLEVSEEEITGSREHRTVLFIRGE